MNIITYTAARATLAKTMDRVNEDRAPILITRQRGPSAVLVSLDEWRGIEETMHLLSSPKNAARLKESLAQIEKQVARDRRRLKQR
ncbi:MAG: type II toxin-antitoxin system prevent-host-death family antitoxin [Betaproteobacteria bacterium]|nr:type II toxin-antitoxin system prevent-host-death family antitoxin [Betaproteobacteria bacterium]